MSVFGAVNQAAQHWARLWCIAAMRRTGMWKALVMWMPESPSSSCLISSLHGFSIPSRRDEWYPACAENCAKTVYNLCRICTICKGRTYGSTDGATSPADFQMACYPIDSRRWSGGRGSNPRLSSLGISVSIENKPLRRSRRSTQSKGNQQLPTPRIQTTS